MSVDFTTPPAGVYPQSDLDQAFHPADPSRHPLPDHSNYALFSSGPSSYSDSSLTNDRYRTNSSSSSSLGNNYSIGGYSHNSFGDSMSSFHPPGSNNYDVHSLSSSYSSGKVSPLTPNDPIPGMHPPGFSSGINQPMKEYPGQHDFADLGRMSSNGYPPNFHNDDFAMGVPSNMGMGFPHQQYPDRMGQYHSDRVHPDAGMMAPMGHNDMMQYRPSGGMPGYGFPNPGLDLPLMPGLEESLRNGARLHSGGSANDLETFMR